MDNWKHIGNGQFKVSFTIGFHETDRVYFEVIYDLHTGHTMFNYPGGLDTVMLNYLQERVQPSEHEKVEMRKQLFRDELCVVLGGVVAPTRSVSDELDKMKDNPKEVGGSAIRRIYNRVKDFLLFS
jgi:hypothetical protein